LSQRYEELRPGVRLDWEKRSLKEFGDYPIGELSERYDLLVVDHPWAGFAAAHDILVPLENYLPKEYLDDQRENSVGKSFESYSFGGSQLALPIDAAAPVAFYRPDLLARAGLNVPETWSDVVNIARQGRLAMAGNAANVLMAFYMLCAGAAPREMFADGNVAPCEVMTESLAALRALWALCDRSLFDCDPIAVYEAMSGRDEFWYDPFDFGYSNYSRKGYSRYPIYAADVVEYHGAMLKTPLGGTGLAVSARCGFRETAVDFARYAASPEIQATLYWQSGGQPGHRQAWLNPDANKTCSGFFANTLSTLENAYLRPRYDGYLAFQDEAGAAVREFLMRGGGVENLARDLNSLYRRSVSAA
jgi:multiple sugar transport system substrate-binding protein